MEIYFMNDSRFLSYDIKEWLNKIVGDQWVYINRNSMGIVDSNHAFHFWIVWG